MCLKAHRLQSITSKPFAEVTTGPLWPFHSLCPALFPASSIIRNTQSLHQLLRAYPILGGIDVLDTVPRENDRGGRARESRHLLHHRIELRPVKLTGVVEGRLQILRPRCVVFRLEHRDSAARRDSDGALNRER